MNDHYPKATHGSCTLVALTGSASLADSLRGTVPLSKPMPPPQDQDESSGEEASEDASEDASEEVNEDSSEGASEEGEDEVMGSLSLALMEEEENRYGVEIIAEKDDNPLVRGHSLQKEEGETWPNLPLASPSVRAAFHQPPPFIVSEANGSSTGDTMNSSPLGRSPFDREGMIVDQTQTLLWDVLLPATASFDTLQQSPFSDSLANRVSSESEGESDRAEGYDVAADVSAALPSLHHRCSMPEVPRLNLFESGAIGDSPIGREDETRNAPSFDAQLMEFRSFGASIGVGE